MGAPLTEEEHFRRQMIPTVSRETERRRTVSAYYDRLSKLRSGLQQSPVTPEAVRAVEDEIRGLVTRPEDVAIWLSLNWPELMRHYQIEPLTLEEIKAGNLDEKIAAMWAAWLARGTDRG